MPCQDQILEISAGPLRCHRLRTGKSMSAVAREIGISFGVLSRWETGRSLPSLAVAWSIADYYAVSLDDLIGRVPPAASGDSAAEKKSKNTPVWPGRPQQF